MVPVYTIHLPEYRLDSEPDHKTLGAIVDTEIKKHFMGQAIVVRALTSDAHPGKSADELISIIQKLGTDHYDPERKGDRYDTIEGAPIDFFAFRRNKVSPSTELFRHITWGFYHGAKAIHGKPERIDILIIYDARKLKAVLHHYQDRTDRKRDGFTFKNPANKPDALRAIFTLTT